MNTLRILLLILCTTNCNYVTAQKDSTTTKPNIVRNFIKKNDIQLILKADILYSIIRPRKYTVALEGCFKKRHSIQGTASLCNYTKTDNTINKSYFSLQSTLEYKFFLFNKKQYTGFYTGPYLLVGSDTHINESQKEVTPYSYIEYNQASIGGGATIGYQNYIIKRIVIDLTVGYGVRQIVDTQVIKIINTELGNQKLTFPNYKFGLNIGYKF